MTEKTKESIKSYALYLVSRREYSVSKIRAKLLKRFPEELVLVEDVLLFLQEQKFLSDERFSELFIEEKVRMGWGRQKIMQKLFEQGVGRSSFVELLEELYEFEAEVLNARKAMESKKRSLKTELNGYERQKKISNFLGSRGFAFDVIACVFAEEI